MLDSALALVMTMRLTRLVTTDFLLQPLRDRIEEWGADSDRRWFYASAVTCPFCIGFWIGVGVLALLAIAGGPGPETGAWWRWLAAALSLNYIAAHITSRFDAPHDDEEQD